MATVLWSTEALHPVEVHTRLHEARRERVPQVVEAEVLDDSLAERLEERLSHRARGDRD